jgi:hypothetical protein
MGASMSAITPLSEDKQKSLTRLTIAIDALRAVHFGHPHPLTNLGQFGIVQKRRGRTGNAIRLTEEARVYHAVGRRGGMAGGGAGAAADDAGYRVSLPLPDRQGQ